MAAQLAAAKREAKDAEADLDKLQERLDDVLKALVETEPAVAALEANGKAICCSFEYPAKSGNMLLGCGKVRRYICRCHIIQCIEFSAHQILLSTLEASPSSTRHRPVCNLKSSTATSVLMLAVFTC